MEENSLIEEHKGLIYLAIKENHIYWRTEDEYQDYIDAGYDGLLQGIRTYDTTKGIKPSTYYYTCIKNEMIKVITLKNRKKNSMKTVSLNTLVDDLDGTELIDLIPGSVDIEQEILDKETKEKLIYYIDHLPIEKDRYVIKMMFGLDGWKQMNASQIARRWGVNKNAIISRKNRALRRLWYRIRKEDL